MLIPMTRIEGVFAGLAEASVDYVLVGGLAVVLRGHARLTADIDIVVDLNPDNARRAIQALTRLGLRPRAPVEAAQFADPVQRRRWVEEKGMRVFSLWHPKDPLLEVDLFVEEPLEFAVLRTRADRLTLRNSSVIVASIQDLIELKRQAGRPQDLLDIEALEAIVGGDDGNQA